MKIYYESSEHLFNACKAMVRDWYGSNGVYGNPLLNGRELLDLEKICEHCFDLDIKNKDKSYDSICSYFYWTLKDNLLTNGYTTPDLLHDAFADACASLREGHERRLDIIKEHTERYKEIHPDLLSISRTLAGDPGVYFLYGADKKLLYVGKSKNLGSRIIESSNERRASYFNYIATENMSDASIMETYLICKLKPKLYSESKHSEPPTIKLDIHEPTDGLLKCFVV